MERVLGQFKEDRKECTYHTMTFENANRGVFFSCKRCCAVGKNTQKIALEAYIRKTGNDVCDCALFLFSCGFLGSSPDGIIYYEGRILFRNGYRKAPMNLSILFTLSLSIVISICILHRGRSTAGLCKAGLNCLIHVKSFSTLLLAIGNNDIWGDQGPCLCSCSTTRYSP